MNPDEIAKIISQEVDTRIAGIINTMHLRGVVNAIVDDTHVDLKIEGSENVTAGVRVASSYVPQVGDRVLILNMGLSGANLLVIAPLTYATDWIVPTLAGSWVTYDGTYNIEGYRKDAEGYVHLKGLVKSGTGTIFTLPVGFRPSRRQLLGTISNNAIGRIDVTPTGTVSMSTGVTNWISLDGLTFKAEQ